MKDNGTSTTSSFRQTVGNTISGTLANVLAVGVIALCGFLWAQRHWVVSQRTPDARPPVQNSASGAQITPLPEAPTMNAAPPPPTQTPSGINSAPSTPSVAAAEPSTEFPSGSLSPGTHYETILGERFPIPYTAIPGYFADDPSHRHSARHTIWQGDLMIDRGDLKGAQQEWRNVINSVPGTPESQLAKQRLQEHP